MILFRILKKKILTKNWNKNKAFIQALPYKNFKHWQKLKPYKKCSAFETKILFFVRFLFQILFLSYCFTFFVWIFLFYYVKQKFKTKEALFCIFSLSFLYLFFVSFLAEKIQRKDKEKIKKRYRKPLENLFCHNCIFVSTSCRSL